MVNELKHSSAAKLCKMIYDHDAPLVSDLAIEIRELVEEVTPIKFDDILILVVETKTRVFVICRGTEFQTKASALRNVESELVECDGYSAHRGYVVAVRMIWDRFLKALPSRSKGKGMTFMGHSAGGTIATLMAVDSFVLLVDSARSLSVNQLITFASPRPGDQRLADIVDQMEVWGIQTDRYTTTNDPVPWLPPMSMGYRNGQLDVYLDRNSQPTLGPWALMRIWDGLVARWMRKTPFAFRISHGIDNYIKKLLKMESLQ